MSDLEKMLNQSLAKPDRTIREHTDDLKLQASLLKQLGYIGSDVLYHDLLSACEYHDYGKANSEFQKRIKNHSQLLFLLFRRELPAIQSQDPNQIP